MIPYKKITFAKVISHNINGDVCNNIHTLKHTYNQNHESEPVRSDVGLRDDDNIFQLLCYLIY